MTNRLEWSKLLCGERCRESATKSKNKCDIDYEFYDHRNEFDKDYDRIVYSSSIRRLQDKAQVFPLQENDFTRTRLTHSLEASALGRSLGYAIGEWLLKKKEEFTSYEQVRELAALLQVSALIHDLGNPPFGHYGEDIIRNWFEKWFENKDFQEINKRYGEKGLTDQQKKDLKNFEGNAQTLRIVSKLQLLNDEYGVNFTYGTLAASIKYLWPSNDERVKDKKKFGYFYSEEKLAGKIKECTGLEIGMKNPVTILLEASDDMAYMLADIEDAVKKGIICWESEYNKVKYELLKEDKETYSYMFNKLEKIKNTTDKKGIPNDDLIAFQNFKILSQSLMFKHVVKEFKEQYDIIMTGEYRKEILKEIKSNKMVEMLKGLAKKHCFVNKEVIMLELVGDNVLNGLLNIFVNPLVRAKKEPETKSYEGKLYSIISDNFKYVCCFDEDTRKSKRFEETSLYERLMLVTDFVSGMTDSYAVNLYKRLKGVKLP